MSTIHPAARRTRRPSKRRPSERGLVPAEHVRAMLREIAFVLHATRVVRRLGEKAPKA